MPRSRGTGNRLQLAYLAGDLEQRLLAPLCRDFQVLQRPVCHTPPARGTVEKADLHQVRLVQLLDGIPLLSERGRDGVHSHRPAFELLLDGQENLAVQLVESVTVDLEPLEMTLGDGARDAPVVLDLGEIAHALQETVGDARGAAGTAGDLLRSGAVDLDTQDARRALDDLDQVAGGVEIQVMHDSEAVPQRSGEESDPGGRAHQREAREIDLDGPRHRTLTDDDVDAELL